MSINYAGVVPVMTPVGPKSNFIRNSTNYAAAYAQTNFLPVIQLEFEDGTLEVQADPLDHKYNKLFDYITQWAPYKYDGTMPLTTSVYQVYRNTTLIWVVLHYNGAIHPLEIEPGYILKMPLHSQILDYFRASKAPKKKTIINM